MSTLEGSTDGIAGIDGIVGELDTTHGDLTHGAMRPGVGMVIIVAGDGILTTAGATEIAGTDGIDGVIQVGDGMVITDVLPIIRSTIITGIMMDSTETMDRMASGVRAE